MPEQLPAKTGSELVVRSSVPPNLPYKEYRETLRLDFWFSCAYCTMAETESMGIRFTIDHYEPQSKRKDLIDEYNNLMWACELCNDHKGSDCPDEKLRSMGYRYFRPDVDEPNDHFELGDVLISGKSNTGEYTVNFLSLNRQQLVRIREIRRRLSDSQELILRGVRALRTKSIDQFPPNLRPQILRVKAQLEKNAAELDNVLRELNRSVLIDPDPSKKQRAKTRRNYLARVRSIALE